MIGSSTGSYYSHNAWFSDNAIFDGTITHPILADTTHAVSRAFDVHKEDLGVSFRGTVIVDNEGSIRSHSVNDLSAGRSPKEALRTAQALKSGGFCGADWKKGDDPVA